MEILVYIILGTVLGISVGNTNIRTKIGEEIHAIITKERYPDVVKDCPMKVPQYKATYKPRKGKEQPKSAPKTEAGGCNKCGGSVEVIDKMPGYFFCTKCNSITSKKKDNANKS